MPQFSFMKLIIIGGGFGGLRLARLLNNKAGFEITLIDNFNYEKTFIL